MKVYTVKFSGVWPVGASAVVVANGPVSAEKVFRNEWGHKYPNCNPDPVTFEEVNCNKQAVIIISDGNY